MCGVRKKPYHRPVTQEEVRWAVFALGRFVADVAFHHGLIGFFAQFGEVHHAAQQMLGYAKSQGWLDKGKKE